VRYLVKEIYPQILVKLLRQELQLESQKEARREGVETENLEAVEPVLMRERKEQVNNRKIF
jgi:hypothetical protein